jgi:hypothetical protein
MATENKPKAQPEPWYPFNSGPPKDKALGGASADGAKPKPEKWYPFEAGRPKDQPETAKAALTAKTAAPAAAPAAPVADFKRNVQPTPLEKLVRAEPTNLFDRLKPEPNVIRPAWEKSSPTMEKVMLAAAQKAQSAGGDRSKVGPTADNSKVAKNEAAAPAARVHVHPPTPPRSAFGEVLHAEAKEMNRANGVIGSALAQGLHPDAIKAVVENRLQGHAREIANNVLAGAATSDGLALKLADSQKVASALQAASSKAINADHAETIVASRLKGDTAVAGVSAVQALAGPSPSITVSEQQLAAAAPVVAPGVFDLPEIKGASQPDNAPSVVAQQNVAPEAPLPAAPTSVAEQPQVAAASAAGVVTPPVQLLESQPLPMTGHPQVAASDAGVVTFPVPAPESAALALPQNPAGPDLALLGEKATETAATIPAQGTASPDTTSGAMNSASAALGGTLSATAAGPVQGTSLPDVGAGTVAGFAESITGAQAPVTNPTAPGIAAAVADALKPEVVIEDRSILASAATAGVAVATADSASNAMAQAGPADTIATNPAAAVGAMSAAASEVLSAKMGELPANALQSVVVVEERSTLGVAAAPATSKSEAAIEERSTYASEAATAKSSVVVDERSTGASLADASAVSAKMESQSSYSNIVGDKLRDAFSAATSITDTVSNAVQGGLAKGEQKLNNAAEAVAQVIQSASAAGAKVSLEDALAAHMQNKGFDAQSIAAAGEIAQAIRQDMQTTQPQTGNVLVLHKEGAELASVVHAKDAASVARPGDSVLAMDTLEKVAATGMDQSSIQELRGAMPEAVKNRSDLELAQSVGPAKSELKGFDPNQNLQREAQKQEKAAAAESRDTAAAMSMG